MTEIRLYKSPWRAIMLILICSAFVLGGIWLLDSDASPKWVSWASIGFFGLGFPVGLFHLFDRRPQIIINETGIFDRTAYKKTINWEIIHDAYLAEIHHQKFICLVIDEDYEPSRSRGKLYQKSAEFSKSLGFQELNISLGQIKVNEKKLLEFVQAMIVADKDEKVKQLRLSRNNW